MNGCFLVRNTDLCCCLCISQPCSDEPPDQPTLVYQDRVTPWLNLPRVSWAQPKLQAQLTWGKLSLQFPWLNLPRVSWAQPKSQAQLTWGKLSLRFPWLNLPGVSWAQPKLQAQGEWVTEACYTRLIFSVKRTFCWTLGYRLYIMQRFIETELWSNEMQFRIRI